MMSKRQAGRHGATSRWPWRYAVALLSLVVALCGCAARAPQRYSRFAEAGLAYAHAFDTLAAEAARSAVETDSRQLELARSGLPRSDRMTSVIAADSLMRERLGLLRDLRRHATLLRNYFGALSALAESDAPLVAGKAAGEWGDSLSALGNRLGKKSIAGAPLANLLQPATQFVIGRLRNRALERELRARSPLIARELELQSVAVRALGEQLRHESHLQSQGLERDEVIRPFVAEVALPADWRQRRWRALSVAVDLPTLEAASAASRRMEEAFRGLVEGRLGRDDLKALLKELQLLRAALGSLRSQEE